jgi:hypothetical protein
MLKFNSIRYTFIFIDVILHIDKDCSCLNEFKIFYLKVIYKWRYTKY